MHSHPRLRLSPAAYPGAAFTASVIAPHTLPRTTLIAARFDPRAGPPFFATAVIEVVIGPPAAHRTAALQLGGKAWLPALPVDRDGWSLTALFSNTALAHELGRTNNWVVIYFSRDGGPEHQRTIVTETRGPLEGRRVVRGRETASRGHYLGQG